MEPKDELIEVDEQQIGLDRTKIISKGRIQLPGHELEREYGLVLPEEAYEHADPEPRSSARRMVDSIKERKHDAGQKIKKSLHIKHHSDETESSKTELPILADTVAPKYEPRQGHKTPKLGENMLKDFFQHPYNNVKAKVADQGNQQVAANIVEEVPHGHDVDITHASIRVESARTENEKQIAIKDLYRLLEERQSTYVRWTLDKHVTKLRVLPRVTRKARSDFMKENAQGDDVTDWEAYGLHLLDYYSHCYGGQYIGYASDPPTPSQQALMPKIMRLLVITGPVQRLALAIRGIYRWEAPRETAKYLALYLLLWHLNLLLSGIIGSIVYAVIRRHFFKPSIETLRQDIKHRENVEKTALTLTEFLEKFGEKEWGDEMLQRLGPWVMVQTGDLADFFESAWNFYEWRRPGRTVALLCIFTGTMLFTAIAPTWLVVKTSTLGVGIAFFAVFPIAVNFPEYRLLVSPTKRLLWNIPTHAEWAIKYVQAEGLRAKGNAMSSIYGRNLDKSAQPRHHGSYKAHHGRTAGRIVIDLDSVEFVSTLGQSFHFTLPYSQIQRLEKEDRILRKHLPTRLAAEISRDLKFVNKVGKEWILTDIDERDEAFSQIVGLSRNTWQVVW